MKGYSSILRCASPGREGFVGQAVLRPRIVLNFLLLFLVFPGSGFADRPFSFLNFTTLRSGQSFAVISEGRPIGSGRILRMDAGRFEFQFRVRVLTEVSATAQIQFTGQTGGKIRLHLRYDGQESGRVVAANEDTEADQFLANANILVFHYSGGRFFQFSRDSAGRNKMVTDWGAATLLPD